MARSYLQISAADELSPKMLPLVQFVHAPPLAAFRFVCGRQLAGPDAFTQAVPWPHIPPLEVTVTLQLLVGEAEGRLHGPAAEEVLQFFVRESHFDAAALRVHHGPTQALFVHLPLEHPLLNAPSQQQAVDVDGFSLSVSPNSGHGLQVGCRIPIDVVEDDTRGADEVQSNAACFGRQEEDSIRAERAVEFFDNGLPFDLRSAAVQPAESVGVAETNFFEHVERGGEVGHNHNLLLALRVELVEQARQHGQFAAVFLGKSADEMRRDKGKRFRSQGKRTVLRDGPVDGKQGRMVAELPQQTDGRQVVLPSS